MHDWFGGRCSIEMTEGVVGLDTCGETLTVLCDIELPHQLRKRSARRRIGPRRSPITSRGRGRVDRCGACSLARVNSLVRAEHVERRAVADAVEVLGQPAVGGR